tara:strand:+ start:46 stop:864 length:819 start_codon:yes stop_codon:yes gene_type:complete
MSRLNLVSISEELTSLCKDWNKLRPYKKSGWLSDAVFVGTLLTEFLYQISELDNAALQDVVGRRDAIPILHGGGPRTKQRTKNFLKSVNIGASARLKMDSVTWPSQELVESFKFLINLIDLYKVEHRHSEKNGGIADGINSNVYDLPENLIQDFVALPELNLKNEKQWRDAITDLVYHLTQNGNEYTVREIVSKAKPYAVEKTEDRKRRKMKRWQDANPAPETRPRNEARRMDFENRRRLKFKEIAGTEMSRGDFTHGVKRLLKERLNLLLR